MEKNVRGIFQRWFYINPGGRIFPENNGEKSVKSVKIKKLPPYFSA